MGQVFLETKDFTKNVFVRKHSDGYSISREETQVFLGEKHLASICLVSDLTLIETHDILTKEFGYSETEAFHLTTDNV